MEELKTWWEVPSIAQFISAFQNVFNLPQIDIEELEESFLASGMPGGSKLLNTVIISLLRQCFNKKKAIGTYNWELYLCKLLNKSWSQRQNLQNPLIDGQKFDSLDLKTKVHIVYTLCIYRLEKRDVERIMRSMEPETLRVQSLGSDSLGNSYWYFYGTRLYKEEPLKGSKQQTNWEEEWKLESNGSVTKKRGRGRPRKSDATSGDVGKQSGKSFLDLDSKSRWSVVCTTLEDWKMFAKKFENSKSQKEVRLYEIISENFLPALGKVFTEKGRRLKRKLLKLSSDEEPSKEDSEKDQKVKKNRKSRSDSCTTASDSESPPKKKNRSRSRSSRSRSAGDGRLNYNNINSTSMGIKPLQEYSVDKKLLEKNFTQNVGVYKKLHEILKNIKIHQDAWPFLNAVDEAIAPGYYDIVKDPIDLSAIERKISLKVYTSLKQVDQDFQKLLVNCRLYNGAKSEYTGMAKVLVHIFRNDLSKVTELLESKESAKADDVRSKGRILKSRMGPRASRRKFRFSRRKLRPRRVEGLDMLAKASHEAIKTPSSKGLCNMNSPGGQRGKKRRRIAPRPTQPKTIAPPGSDPCTSPASGCQIPVSTAFNVINPVSRSPQNKAVSPDSSSYELANAMIRENGVKSYRESNLACTPAPSSEPQSLPYPSYNGFNSTPRFTTAAENFFWNAKNTCPTYSISNSHSPTLPLLSVSQSSLVSNGYSIMNGDSRLQPLCPVSAVENSYPVQITEKNTLPVPNSSQSSLFSGFPIVYTVPSTSVDSTFNGASKDNGQLVQSSMEAIRPAVHSTHVLHGIPPRPMQDLMSVPSQQLRPHYLSLPHYMVPPQQPLPPLLPAPLLPTFTITNDSVNHTDLNSVPQAVEKAAPVYTVLQNVPLKQRQ